MNDPFNISFEKTSFHRAVTADGHNIGMIRWGMVKGSDEEFKMIAFYVPWISVQFAYAAGKNPVQESDSIATRPEVLSGPKFQAYEWVNTEFESVPADKQTWFRFA